MPQAAPLLCYFGHHKCASTWIFSILDTFATDAGLRMAYLHGPRKFGDDLAGYVYKERVDFVSYVNADRRWLANLPPFRGFHVVRDPRDILVSAYFSHKGTHPTEDFPELPAHRERLHKASKEEGLLLEMDFAFTRGVMAEMFTWDYHQEQVLELKQEDLTPDPYRGFLRIFDFLGLLDLTHLGKRQSLPFLLKCSLNVAHRHHPRLMPLRFPLRAFPGERLLGIVFDNRFEKYAGGRKQGEENVQSHYRKGEAGDWMNHFTAEHVEHFKRNYNELLLKLGYETRPDWRPARLAAAAR